ncbi:MAG: STAS domain-containing protein [Planctomycetota bacterium]|nr:STAS domain-containing protein [Planctomycetota bacterium]
MANELKFFRVKHVEGVPEITLGSADFVSRPVIVLAKEELKEYVDLQKPLKLVMNFRNVGHISSEFIAAMIDIQEHVVGYGGTLKISHMNPTVQAPFQITNLAGRLFMIYETTPEAIDAF